MPMVSWLGIQSMRALHVYHLLGHEFSSASVPNDISDYVGFQPLLETVDFHLEDHFQSAVGDNILPLPSIATVASAYDVGSRSSPKASPINRAPEDSWYIVEYTETLSRIVNYLAYSDSLIRRAYPGRQFPMLSKLTIHLPVTCVATQDTGEQLLPKGYEMLEVTKQKLLDNKPEGSELEIIRLLKGSLPTDIELRTANGGHWILVS